MMTIHQLCDKLALSRAMIYKLIKDRWFPKPHKFGKASRWDAAAVDEWVSARKSA